MIDKRSALEVSGIVLAGGRSTRMGRDKSLLVLSNETLIERVIRKMQNVTDEIIIASNDTAKYNIPGITEVVDTYPGTGPLGGLHAGLLKMTYQHAFVVSCDMPLFSGQLASYLLEQRAGYDVIAPYIGGYWEPLCAVYSRNCIPAIQHCLEEGVRKIIKFYSQVRVRPISEQELIPIDGLEEVFFNLNTPEDLSKLLVQRKGGGRKRV
ncbi:molybdenum cofactor guanylyltransferase [Sporomusa sp.]|uniref:molybdenum cofactor guanylyltransferase n=1 Tax=Sporomusa sp. TaxID=2078658 RepID=UPI002CFDA230|nr:molybdenum cofactor guanylyltransferase [Sporomusa sp.]HWR45519.1 molybdenum cofactor guanylyltransferase [Sporomusa sp.]